ncbi:Bromodomain-containing protein [Achaetomium macrosporum]|uniref:Bromodomain-containing protein n=1 Tax=Achaetomium macrosporum TaxID=79813 RepID=A0AAN7HAI9_9PEZI|nr:Bromodomain-containing protein [Achaetomium macrosporum]
MDNKRKASPTGVGTADANTTVMKRRRMPGPPTDYDLLKGETHESTTAYGLHFLETIRRTKDKSGRLVASYFEDLLPRETNKEYYERIRMPISLKIIEQKLHNQDFKNLSELESYFKRMVTNAKEFYPKNSEIFEDAERVRKALSNYMTKTNPAYKLIPNYACQAAPIPADMQAEPEDLPASRRGKEESEDADMDAEGEEDVQGDEEDAQGDEDEGDEEEDGNSKKIVLKRRGPGRPPRAGSEASQKLEKSGRVKADHEYEGVPYKGLSFQQAQEKIVEELIRKSDGSGPYFLDFINLPPRSYKDYFAVITNPLSLKGLQKLVKGIHGRQPATGVSDFKNWAAFEEKASLLWSNAHYYNEEGSEIHTMATELKKCFEKELNEAKAVVQEPPQPKIKLKMTPGQETPVVGSKKITIHVGGSRGSTAASPAPQTGQSSDLSRPDAAATGNRDAMPAAAIATGSGSQTGIAGAQPASVASPSPSLVGAPMSGVGPQQKPAVPPQPNSNAPGVASGQNGMPAPGQNMQPLVVNDTYRTQSGRLVSMPAPYDAPQDLTWCYPYRAPGRGYADSLMPELLIRTHPGIAVEPRFREVIPAHPKEAFQTIVFHLTGQHTRLQVIPRLRPFEQEMRPYRIWVMVDGQIIGRAAPLPVTNDPLPQDALVFEAPLHQGSTVIHIDVVAGLPKGQTLVNGATAEVERLTIMAYLRPGGY